MSHITKSYCKACLKYYEGRGKFYCSNLCCKKDKDYQKKRSLALKGKPTWNKGIHVQTNDNLRIWREKGGKPWNKGLSVHLSPKSEFKTGDVRIVGENNNNWKGGVTSINESIRKSKEYKEWKMKVHYRDKFTCVNCGYRSKTSYDIRADHIKPFSLYPKLRFDVKNGRTLCIPCDLELGWNSLREENSKFNYHVIGQNI